MSITFLFLWLSISLWFTSNCSSVYLKQQQTKKKTVPLCAIIYRYIMSDYEIDDCREYIKRRRKTRIIICNLVEHDREIRQLVFQLDRLEYGLNKTTFLCRKNKVKKKILNFFIWKIHSNCGIENEWLSKRITWNNNVVEWEMPVER